ncbi:hypothetical protein D9M73_162420 [compost metagenome]
MVLELISSLARAYSCSASDNRERAWASWPCAWVTAAWKLRESMTNSRSPFLTIEPSVKATFSR